jgi:hypothetical protein
VHCCQRICTLVDFWIQIHWDYYIPPVHFAITYILCLVMCFAVGIMLAWHLFAISVGETAVEGHDHDAYRRIAKERGGQFVNSYDLGCVVLLCLLGFHLYVFQELGKFASFLQRWPRSIVRLIDSVPG